MKLMLAYGMNTNLRSMANRCPNAVSIGRYDLHDHRIVFRGCADVEPSKGDIAQCVLWNITDECEESLDILEGYPHFYTKKYVTIEYNDKLHDAMIYHMNDYYDSYYSPNKYYQQMLEEGYSEHGLDLEQIYTARGFTYSDDSWIEEYKNAQHQE